MKEISFKDYYSKNASESERTLFQLFTMSEEAIPYSLIAACIPDLEKEKLDHLVKEGLLTIKNEKKEKLDDFIEKEENESIAYEISSESKQVLAVILIGYRPHFSNLGDLYEENYSFISQFIFATSDYDHACGHCDY